MSDIDTTQATERTPLLSNLDAESRGQHVQAQYDPQDQRVESEAEEESKSTRTIQYTLPVLSIGIFLASLDQSVVATINGDIGSDLHALRNVSWIATAYFLSMTCSHPLFGKLSDVFGRKPSLLFAYTMFAIGSLGCGLTGTIGGLIAARAVQGIGGGGMLIVATVLLSDLIPIRDRGTYQGYLNLVGAIGSTSGGPVGAYYGATLNTEHALAHRPIGGLFAQTTGWRWVFLIQVFLCLVAIIAVPFLVRLPEHKSDLSWREQLRRVDFLGAALLILSIFALLFGLDRGTNLSWHSPTTLVSLCLTVPLVIAFLLVETKFAVAPFTPSHVIFDRALFACYAQNFFGYAGLTALIFYLPLFYQVVLLMTPAQAGAGLIPAAISGVVGTLVGGLILKRIGKYYRLAVISASVAALASIPIAIAPAMQSGSLITICVASVASFVPQVSNVAAADQAVATASSFLFRSLGSAIGVSLVGLVIDQVLGAKIRAALDPQDADQILGKIKSSLDFIKLLRPELQIAVRESYSAALQSGFVMCSALLAISAFCVMLWRAKRMP
ncbi:MAG: hypothetical protein Q9196_005984 [Gyalolechia fulgens]